MASWRTRVNAESHRITNFFNKPTKPTFSRPPSSRSGLWSIITQTRDVRINLTWTHFPLSSSRARASDAQVKNLVKLIEKVRDGQYKGEELLIRGKLSDSEYWQLLQSLEESNDKLLQAYFNKKLRSFCFPQDRAACPPAKTITPSAEIGSFRSRTDSEACKPAEKT